MTARRAAAVLLALAGCGKSPAPAPLDHAPADRPAPVATGDSMKDKLREIAAKAAADPDRHPDFRLSYQRGHALSGTTTFTVNGAGAYTLESNVTAGRAQLRRDGTLSAAQRDGVLRLLVEHDVLAIPAPARNIADDEEPVVLEVGEGDQQVRLMIWHGDGAKDPRFHPFETGLLALVRELSGGAVLTSADY